MSEPERDQGVSRRAAWLLVPLALVGASMCAWSLFANVTLGEAESFIAAPLHSAALANYAQDPIGGRLQSLSIRIIEFAIQDREPETDDAGARATDVVESLKSPVPTVTPKPGDPTYTATAPATAAATATIGSTGTATPTASPSRTPTRTPSAIPTDPPTAGPSPTPTKTPTPGPSSTATRTPTPSSTPTACKVPPYIEMVSPSEGQRFTVAQELPGQAFAFDPDNANPLTCSTTPPGTDGQGIPTATPTPAVEFYVERWNGVSWVAVHYRAQNIAPYCAFTGTPLCNKHDLSGGQWPDTTPINTGLHRMKTRVVRDDEGVASGWVSVNFYIDPVSTATPTPSNTPTPTPSPTLPPTATPTPACSVYSLTGFSGSSNDASWTLTNGGATAVTIIGIDLQWTLSGSLNTIKLDGATIWNVGDPTSPANITSGWTGVSLLFNPSGSKELRFNFDNSVGGSTFTVTVHFDNGCDVTASDGA
ncbi:MAG: hypothetical protein ACRDHG_11390 [Anaerolineales bacterium]